MAFTPVQQRFRFYNDDGTDTTSTAAAAENANLTITEGGGNKSYQLRFQVQESGGTAGANTDDWQLQASRNGGAYFNVTTTSAYVKAFDSANLTDAVPISAPNFRLTAGTGTAEQGEVSEDGLLDNRQITASNYTEFLYTVQTIDADLAPTDTLDFRLLYNGATFTYSVTPRITNEAGGAISGISTLTFTPAGVLTGSGALSGASSLTFTVQAALTWVGGMRGSSSLTFTPSATGQLFGFMSGATSLSFSVRGLAYPDHAYLRNRRRLRDPHYRSFDRSVRRAPRF